MQQLILGTGTAIWWLTEPHRNEKSQFSTKSQKLKRLSNGTTHFKKHNTIF
jgi:hypothetical protein